MSHIVAHCFILYVCYIVPFIKMYYIYSSNCYIIVLRIIEMYHYYYVIAPFPK
jgi:hypothetical protein